MTLGLNLHKTCILHFCEPKSMYPYLVPCIPLQHPQGTRYEEHWLLQAKQLPAIRKEIHWSYSLIYTTYIHQGWGQIRFIKYKYKYKYIFSGVSNTNTNTNTSAKIWSNTNTNTNTAHQIQIQIQIHNEAETKLPLFYRWHIEIYCILRRLFIHTNFTENCFQRSMLQ